MYTAIIASDKLFHFMLRFISTYQGMPILSLRVAGTVAYVQKPIVDPQKLQVKGFYVTDSKTKQTLILLIDDVRDHISKGLVINDHDVLAEPDDLVRLKPLLEHGFNPISMPVEDTTGKKLGKVSEYAIEHTSFFIHRLHYKKGLLSGIGTDSSFSRTQIAELTDQKFVIQGTEIKNTAKKAALKVPTIEPAYSTASSSALETRS